MKYNLIAAYVGLFIFAFNGTTMILNFSVLQLASTAIGFMMAGHHFLHYRELKALKESREALKQSREATEYVVTTANDVLAPLNKQFVLSPKDFQYHLGFWPCTKNTIVTEGLEYRWFGIKKSDIYSSIGGVK